MEREETPVTGSIQGIDYPILPDDREEIIPPAHNTRK